MDGRYGKTFSREDLLNAADESGMLALGVSFLPWELPDCLRMGCTSGEWVWAVAVMNPLVKGADNIGNGVKAVKGIKFGQDNVKSTFAHGPFKGKTIGEVAEELRSGKISPDELPVEFVVRNGERVALNNRSLTALRRAGLLPTKTIDRTGSKMHEQLLNSHLDGGQPSDFIRIRGAGPNASLIE